MSSGSGDSDFAFCVLIKAFSIYQLTNKRISSGIGCGYYDENGSGDQGGIYRAMNDYLFDACFAQTDTNEGFFHFISYLMIGFEASFDSPDGRFRKASPALNVLDSERLENYWKSNRDAIIAKKFDATGQRVVTPNYSMRFEEGVPQITAMLDDLYKMQSAKA